MHAREVGKRAAHAAARNLKREAVPRFEQHGVAPLLRRHEPLADGAVRSLPEVAALGVLEVRLARDQRDAHVGDRRGDERSLVLALHGVREDEALPVEIEVVGGADGSVLHARSARQRLQEQVCLDVVAQRLVVAVAHDGRRDGLLVEDRSLSEGDIRTEALVQALAHDLQLDGTHEHEADLAELVVPCHTEHRILLRELAQDREDRVLVDTARLHAVREDGREQRAGLRGLRAEHVSRTNLRESRHRAHCTS